MAGPGVTIGSPLGLPHVKARIREELDVRRIHTPDVVTLSWVNFADPGDVVAIDPHLSDDYRDGNAHGVRVRDDLVANRYTYREGGREVPNHHKSYGYLRVPEMARHLAEVV